MGETNEGDRENNHHNHRDTPHMHQKSDISFNPKQFYIQNRTGEILKFKTTHQPAFTELQAEELHEIEFNSKNVGGDGLHYKRGVRGSYNKRRQRLESMREQEEEEDERDGSEGERQV